MKENIEFKDSFLNDLMQMKNTESSRFISKEWYLDLLRTFLNAKKEEIIESLRKLKLENDILLATERRSSEVLKREELKTKKLELEIRSLFIEKCDDMSIHELDLSARAATSLLANDIEKIGQLKKMTNNELSTIPSLGKKSMREIVAALKIKGIELKKEGKQ